MGFSHVLRLCLQGGGVYISGGTVSFSSCTITGNTAAGVRAQLKSSHRPNGIFTCLRSLVLAGRRCLCQQRHGYLLIVHHHWQLSSICACSRSKVPIAPMETCLVDMFISILIFDSWCCLDLPAWSTCHLRLKLQNSHRPDGILTCFALVPGRRCDHCGWHGDLLIVHHHWQLC